MKNDYDFSESVKNPYILCQMCKRDTPQEVLEKHHLIPKSRKNKKKRTIKNTIKVCVDCGDQLHQLFTNKEMEKTYNTIETILEDERIQKWIDWVKDKKRFGMCMAKKKRR